MTADLAFGKVVAELFRGVRGVFDDPSVSEQEAITQWNRFRTFIDDATKHPGDTVVLHSMPLTTNGSAHANPPGISLRSMLESSARCFDLRHLDGMDVRPSVRDRFVRESCRGEYVALIDQLVSQGSRLQIPHELVTMIIPKIVGLALQSPLTSVHLAPQDGEKLRWRDLCPTWRYKMIVDAILHGCLPATDLMSPDVVCDKLGWPRVSEMFTRVATTAQYKGLNKAFAFGVERHKAFCELASAGGLNLIWLPDINSDVRFHALIEASKQFYPPFHFAAGELIFHKTADYLSYDDLVDMFVGILITTAVREMMFATRLEQTNELLQMFVAAHTRQGASEAGEWFAKKAWPAAFQNTFLFSLADIGVADST